MPVAFTPTLTPTSRPFGARVWAVAAGLLAGAPWGLTPPVQAQEAPQKEVRVLRPRYFPKTHRVELGVNGVAVVDQAFAYTYMGGAHLGFHFNDSFGLYGEGQMGFSAPKSDCSTLGETFSIDPIIFDLKWAAGGRLAWTPAYGKYQMANGDVIYFDFLVDAGGGVMGVQRREHMCSSPNNRSSEADTKTVPQFNFGMGQRVFLDKSLSFNWNIRVFDYKVDLPDRPKSFLGDFSSNVFITMGIGYFL